MCVHNIHTKYMFVHVHTFMYIVMSILFYCIHIYICTCVFTFMYIRMYNVLSCVHIISLLSVSALHNLRLDVQCHVCTILSFSLSARKGRSWVVDRVVGPADWMTPDDTLREQMKRLQIYG